MATLEKSRVKPGSGYRKFIASVLTHALSREIARKNFEVVLEGNLDLHNPESDAPDVIVYAIHNNYAPTQMIELCDNASEQSTLKTMEIIREIYFVKEAFVYNYEKEVWYNCNSFQLQLSSYSNQFQIELDDLLRKYLHRYI